MSTMKRTKPLISSNDNDPVDSIENQPTVKDSSPILTKKLNEDMK